MQDVYIVGAGMTRFFKNLAGSVKGMAAEAVEMCLKDAGLAKKDIQACYVSNSFWGFFSNQQSIRGQVMLRPAGIEGVPIINTENACCGGGTAVHLAYTAVA
ncbi:MAG: thiolase family protein, partial [Desulfocucumaceae bacterium]